MIYDAFIDKEEDIVTGIVQRQDPRNMYVDLGKVEAVLPLNELMPTEQVQARRPDQSVYHESGEYDERAANFSCPARIPGC